jgi:alpha-D-ribose 1-methylphosphonate 5-triphosphate synthase subunit PhnG
MTMTIPPRNLWVKALTVYSSQNLQSLAESLTNNWQVKYKYLPQSGLNLLQVQDSVFHEPYYLGEIPVAIAWIELSNQSNETYEGAAQVMSDSAELAVDLAICDAVLANQLPGWQKVANLIKKGLEKRDNEEAQLGIILAKTKVNFSLLNQKEDDTEY